MTAIVETEEGSNPPVYLTYEDYPEEDLFLYAGIDCLVTTDLASELMKEACQETDYVEFVGLSGGKVGRRTTRIPSVWEAYQETTAAALEFIIDLELNGIAYNVPLNRIIDKRMVEELGELEERIFSGIGRRVNLNSGQELRKLLYEEEGFEVKAFTKTGEASTDGDAIKELAKAYPDKLWLPDLAKRNDINSLRNTFVATYHEDFVKSDGKIHPSYNLHGTGSFRISGEEPNLTQLPRPKHGYNLRTMYGEEEGTLFLAFDFSSAEVSKHLPRNLFNCWDILRDNQQPRSGTSTRQGSTTIEKNQVSSLVNLVE